jgi:anaerobic ribonucleoside-triphosphate reductase activating protein
MKVRLAGIVNESVSDGPGLRIALFFQGCGHHCPGCHNPQTWDFSGGDEYEVVDLLDSLVDTPLIRGVTLSGGDPFYQPEAAAEIARVFHARGKDVWAYTGYVWEEIVRTPNAAVRELIQNCDVIVDGPFIQAQAQAGLHYCGSANQRLIVVCDSLRSGSITQWKSSFPSTS